MTTYLCNASVPRPGAAGSGDRVVCTLPQYDDRPNHGAGPADAQHWHPTRAPEVSGRATVTGYSWHDCTGGAIPHDPTTAVPSPVAPDPEDEGPTTVDLEGGVRFTRTEVQRMIGQLRGWPDEIAEDVLRALETRLAEHDDAHDED